MKNPSNWIIAIVSFLLLIPAFTSNAQTIQKRKHLKGYHVDWSWNKKGTKKVEKQETEVSETISDTSSKSIYKDEPITVIRKTSTSAFIEVADSTTPPIVISERQVRKAKKATKPVDESKRFGGPRKNTSMREHSTPNSAQAIEVSDTTELPKTDPRYYRNRATTGFTLVIAAIIISLVASVSTGGLFFLAFILAILGLVLSIGGIKSDYKALAIVGTVLGVLAIAAVIIAAIDSFNSSIGYGSVNF